ncbi:MAG TPA: SEC-C metal-binding domain-containing protein [Oscillatoriaceae cyanobacterium]
MEPTQSAEQAQQTESPAPKIKAMRRQPCPCGSGKVFKNCHEGDPRYEVATDPSTAVAPPPVAEKPGQKGHGPSTFKGPAPKFTGPAHKTSTKSHRKV